MANKDFTTTLLVDQTPNQVFKAINHASDWWQGEIKGKASNLNDEFTYKMEDFHMSKQKVVEFVPDKKVVWLVTDSKLNFISDKSEWNGTKIVFEISEKGNKTQMRFTHVGLAPAVEYYNDCSNAWSQLVTQSLFSLITTGKGKKVF